MVQCQQNFQNKKFTRNTHQAQVDFQVCLKAHTPSASSNILHVSCNKKKIRKEEREEDEFVKKRIKMKKFPRNTHPAHVDFQVVKKFTLHQLLPLFSTFSMSEKQNRKERAMGDSQKKNFQDVETLTRHMLLVKFVKKSPPCQLFLPNISMLSVSELKKKKKTEKKEREMDDTKIKKSTKNHSPDTCLVSGLSKGPR